MASQGGKSTKGRQVPVLEWASAAVGLLLTLVVLGVIGWEALTSGQKRPPALDVQVAQIQSSARGFVVELSVRNRSASTALAVQIVGELRSGQEVVETSTATLDYVPGNGVGHAGLLFSKDPARYQLQARATGYAEP